MRYVALFSIIIICSLAPISALEPNSDILPVPEVPTTTVLENIILPEAVVSERPLLLELGTLENLLLGKARLPEPKVKAPIAITAKTIVTTPISPKASEKPMLKSNVSPIANSTATASTTSTAKPASVVKTNQAPTVVSPKTATKPAANPTITPSPSEKVQKPLVLASETKPSGTTSAAPDIAKVQANIGQVLHLTLPGIGWLYLGTGATNDGVVYQQSAVENDSTRFILRLDGSGIKNLQFQRQDGQRGTMERREVNLNVDATRSKGTVATVLEKNSTPIQAPADQAKTATYELEELSTSPESMFTLAKTKEGLGRQGDALALYNRVLEENPNFTAMDELLFRKAAILEKASDKARIREAFELYLRISAEFPYSSHAEAAKQRARYLDRNYFNLR